MSAFNIPSQGMFPSSSIADMIQPPAIGISPKAGDGRSFSAHLTEAAIPPDVDVTFSRHAQRRIESRGIDLAPQDWVQLDQAIDLAHQKGAHDSLVLIDGKAFVVNVDNRTVITAMNSAESKGGVFTKIDSTVVMG